MNILQPPPLTDEGRRALRALAWMVEQYLRDGDLLDNRCMSAGERAMKLLADHGFIHLTHCDRCGQWTEAGQALLDERD